MHLFKKLEQPKAAIIGMGTIAPMHVKSLEAAQVTIAAVCDKKADIAESFASKLNCKAFTDYEKMLEVGGFDVLHICLPHFLHAPVAVSALEKGFHVLCEKPMATNVDDAEKMIAAAEKSGAVLGVILQNRYGPGASLIKETIESGALGKAQGGWLRVTWNRGESYYKNSDWRGKWATEGGGVLINQAIHTFDMMAHLLGHPTSVTASIANRAHPSIEVEDVSEGVIHFKDVSVSFFVNTYHPYDAPASLELVFENGKVALTGEDAVIEMNDGQKKSAGADVEAQRVFGMKSYWGVSHVKQIKAFYESLAKGIYPKTGGADGLRTQRLINGIYESAKSGQRVEL